MFVPVLLIGGWVGQEDWVEIILKGWHLYVINRPYSSPRPSFREKIMPFLFEPEAGKGKLLAQTVQESGSARISSDTTERRGSAPGLLGNVHAQLW